MNKVLILGSGLVAKPMVEYLLNHGFRIVIASPMKGRADEMIAGNPMGASVDWSMDDPETLEMLVAGNDIVVSLLPYKFHPQVASLCLRQGKHLVTTSYIKPEMQGFHEAAGKAGILFMNECGLDPGIDHMTAMKIIDFIHSAGGRILEFYSICGALPAPEAADNPMKYKFTWSPKGVILASLNNALYRKDGKTVSVDSEDVFRTTFISDIPGTGKLEAYPNRDSLSFAEVYGIPDVNTIYRGTFRFPGWCESIDAMKRLNMFDDKVRDYTGTTARGFLAERAGTDIADLKQNISSLLKVREDSAAIRSLDYLDFFSDERLSYYETTPFEITSDRMIQKMMLGDNERDMVILQHIVLCEWQNGRQEVIRTSLTDYGSPSSNTAIARTVALPASIAVKLILEGRISVTGVQRPVLPEIYIPILAELADMGIQMKEEYNLSSEVLPVIN